MPNVRYITRKESLGLAPVRAIIVTDLTHSLGIIHAGELSPLRVVHRAALVIEIDLKPKMHLYAPGVQHYIPIDWQMAESRAWIAFPAAYPASKMLNLPAIKETVPVYTNHIRIVRDVAVGLDPEVTPALAADRTLSVEGSFNYQACDDKECYLPKTIPLNWTFKVGQLDTKRVPEDLQRKTPSK